MAISALVLLLPSVPPVLASQRTDAVIPRQTVTARNATQAQLHGTVVTPDGRPVPRTTVRARNLNSGDIDGATVTTMEGDFTITVPPGPYLIEVVDSGGRIIGTSALASASTATTVTVPTITITTGAESAAGFAAVFGGTTARAAIISAAATAGVVGVVVARDTTVASPSR